MSDFDLYKELEVPKSASQEEIKKSYRKLAIVTRNKNRNTTRIKTKTQARLRNSNA